MKLSEKSRFAAFVFVPALVTGAFSIGHLHATTSGCCGVNHGGDCTLDYPYYGCQVESGGDLACQIHSMGNFPDCCAVPDFCS